MTVLLTIVCLSPRPILADQRLHGIACRSVHLAYEAPAAALFHNEMTVEESHPGSYFMACGFNMGYFGIQEVASGKKLVLFSVWDPTRGDNPNDVKNEDRVKVLYQAPDVRVKRFGGEGTGGQCFFDYDWKTGQTYRFVVRSDTTSNMTAFTGFFFMPESNQWKKLVTFETRTGRSGNLRGMHSFVEDFMRNRTSATLTRRASLGNGWVRTPEGAWREITTAKFTADSNPDTRIDAGTIDRRFFLATGGDLTNSHTKLWQSMTREPGPRLGIPDAP